MLISLAFRLIGLLKSNPHIEKGHDNTLLNKDIKGALILLPYTWHL